MIRLTALLIATLGAAFAPVGADAEQEAVGRMNVAGFRTLEMCTGTLVAPTLVLTAAHCVTDPETGAAKRVSDMVFVAGWDGHGHGGAARASALEIHPDAYPDGRLDIAHDLALVILSKPIEGPVAPIGQSGPTGPFTLMGYRRSAPQRLAVMEACASVRSRGLWRIRCSVERGQSGGPVFFGEGAARRLVAVIVGLSDGAALAVPVDGWLRRRIAER